MSFILQPWQLLFMVRDWMTEGFANLEGSK